MSENIYAEPGITNKVHLDREDKESVVDIYVSAESLRVYDNPWVESTSPNTPGPQHTGTNTTDGRRFIFFTSSLCGFCEVFVASECSILEMLSLMLKLFFVF